MKEVFLYHATPNLHSIYKSMINNPPAGYTFTLPSSTLSKKFLAISQKSSFLKTIYRSTLKKVMNNRNLSAAIVTSKIPKDTALVFAFGMIIDEKFPYILDIIDNPYSITGYNYSSFIENLSQINARLEKDDCKSIIVPFQDCKQMCKKYFTPKVVKKIQLINYGVKSRPVFKRKVSKSIQFLFLGSLANPDDFEIKGGVEALTAFAKLRKRYGSKVSLVVRCKIPEYVKKTYDLEGINFITKPLSEKELEELYISSHVLLTPAHTFVATAPLEAMSFGIPVIGRDTYGTGEYIQHKKNGFLVGPGKHFDYTDYSYMGRLKNKTVIENMRIPDEKTVIEIYSAMSYFVDKPSLIVKYGNFSREIVRKRFSIDARNKNLKKVFDKGLTKS